MQSKYSSRLQAVLAFQGLCTEQLWCLVAQPAAGLLPSGCSSPLSQNLHVQVNLSLHPKISSLTYKVAHRAAFTNTTLKRQTDVVCDGSIGSALEALVCAHMAPCREQAQPGMLEALGALCPQLLTSVKTCSALLTSSKLVTWVKRIFSVYDRLQHRAWNQNNTD